MGLDKTQKIVVLTSVVLFAIAVTALIFGLLSFLREDDDSHLEKRVANLEATMLAHEHTTL